MYKVIKLIKKYILVTLLFFFFVIGTYLVSNFENTNEVRAVFNMTDLKSKCDIKEIVENTDNYNIKVYYPETKYKKLNEKINEKIKSCIEYFKNEIDGIKPQENTKYQLQITFNSYEYNEYFSYVFEIFYDFGGAHPNAIFWTVTYDVNKNKIIDIKSLVDKNKNILKLLSEYTFNELKSNEKIKENYVEDMLSQGTKPDIENFSNFAFTEKGLKIFFERYSVAPYSSGTFSVVVPYEKLNIL